MEHINVQNVYHFQRHQFFLFWFSVCTIATKPEDTPLCGLKHTFFCFCSCCYTQNIFDSFQLMIQTQRPFEPSDFVRIVLDLDTYNWISWVIRFVVVSSILFSLCEARIPNRIVKREPQHSSKHDGTEKNKQKKKINARKRVTCFCSLFSLNFLAVMVLWSSSIRIIITI